LRLIADGEITAEEAVRAYHGVLQKLGIGPQRSLEDDMQLQTNVMSYGGSGVTTSHGTEKKKCACKSCDCPKKSEAAVAAAEAGNGTPDFSKMTTAEKMAYHKARWDRILG